MINYRKKYLHIYIWQAASILLGFVSLFVVIPYLSSNQTLYGVYSICTSLTIFFSYADLGFLNASKKYGAEYYVQNRLEDEVKIVGFVFFLMLVVFASISGVILFFSYKPLLLIPELIVGSEEYNIARKLLLILSVSCFFILVQRVINVVYTIRVEDYKFNKIAVLGSVIKILSVFCFFSGDRYRLVEYYAFFHFVNLIVSLIVTLQTRQYGYGIRQLISSIKFDKEVFRKVWKISLTTLIAMLCAMLYLELDQLAISHMFGISSSAIYGIALAITNIVRSYCSLVYSPYTSRYNHYVGLGDSQGLFNFLGKMIVSLSPLIIFPVLVVALTAKPFIISWVGFSYVDSAMLASLMVLSFLPYFLKEPVTNYLYAVEKNRVNMKLFVFNPVIYWLGIILTYKVIGLTSFALFKFLAPSVLSVFYLVVVLGEFKTANAKLTTMKDVLLHLLLPSVFCCGICILTKSWFIYEHSKAALAFNIMLMGLCMGMSFMFCLVFNKPLRQMASGYIISIKQKKNNDNI